MCQSTSCTLLRRVRFIGQPDGWWSRVDAWTLVENCCAPSVDRFGNRKLTFDVVASGIIIALIQRWSAICG